MHADKKKGVVIAIMDKMAGASKPEPEEKPTGDVGLETAVEEFFKAGAAKDWAAAATSLKSAMEMCGSEEEEPPSYPAEDDDDEDDD